MATDKAPTIRLPKSWKPSVRSAMLHVVSLAQYAAVYTRSWAADSTNQRVRLKAENDRAQQELALLREELRINCSTSSRPAAVRHCIKNMLARIEGAHLVEFRRRVCAKFVNWVAPSTRAS